MVSFSTEGDPVIRGVWSTLAETVTQLLKICQVFSYQTVLDAVDILGNVWRRTQSDDILTGPWW